MSIARNCPYSDDEENCRCEIFAWQPRLNKCSTCERFLKKRFPNIDTSSYNIDENGNVLRDKRITIRKLYDEVIRQKSKLDNAIELLSKRASEIYGKDLVADLCSGFEIEFRLSDYNNPHSTGENVYNIETTIEELEKMETKNDRAL